jgi:hypothetical protein
MVLGLSASTLGSAIRRTPSLNLASAFSVSTMKGNWMVRLNVP